MKNRMFVGTSISEAFWEGFGRFLGGRNLRFSYFFQLFFEANFAVRFGRPKKGPKSVKNDIAAHFGAGPAECAEPGGEIERG